MNRKITSAQIDRIVTLRLDGVVEHEIAKDIGLSRSTVSFWCRKVLPPGVRSDLRQQAQERNAVRALTAELARHVALQAELLDRANRMVYWHLKKRYGGQ